MIRSALAFVFVCAPGAGCTFFASTPAAPGGTAEAQQGESVPTSTVPTSTADAGPEPEPEPDVEVADPEPPQKRKRRRNLSKGWALVGDFSTSPPTGFLPEHLGIPHDESLRPIGVHRVVPNKISPDNPRSIFTVTVDGASTETDGKLDISSDVVSLRAGYNSGDREISILSTAQTRCTTVVHNGTLRGDRRVPGSARFLPYEVCSGYAVRYRISVTDKTFSGGLSGEIDLGEKLRKKGGLAWVLGFLASDFLRFEGSLSGFKEKHNVDVNVFSYGFDLESSRCSAKTFLSSDDLLACLKVGESAGIPIIVRWRRFERSAVGESGACRDYRLSGYRYDPRAGTSGPFLVSMVPDGGNSQRASGASGEFVGLTVSAGGDVAYTIRRTFPRGEQRPEIIEDGVLSIPDDPRVEFVTSHTGRLRVEIDCIRTEG